MRIIEYNLFKIISLNATDRRRFRSFRNVFVMPIIKKSGYTDTVGDCAIWPYQEEAIHVEHWEHAHDHGQAVAKNILKAKSHPYTIRPYFWTDQYDQTFEYLGHALRWDKIITRGSLDDREFTLAYVDKNNHPLAIFFANNGDTRKEVTEFMDKNQTINEEKFKNMNLPL